jgi:hypothetical protein
MAHSLAKVCKTSQFVGMQDRWFGTLQEYFIVYKILDKIIPFDNLHQHEQPKSVAVARKKENVLLNDGSTPAEQEEQT